MIEVNAETDFVAKNGEFIEFANKVADAAAEAKANSRSWKLFRSTARLLPRLCRSCPPRSVKLELKRAVTVEGDKVAVYLHHRSADLPPAVGVLVTYEGDGADAARAAAMQVAALKAKYLNSDEVPADIVAKEREIAEATAREEGKPERLCQTSSRVA